MDVEEFKDIYNVAGLSDEEIELIIGETQGKRSRYDEQRLLGQTMRRKGRRGGAYDPRTGINVSGGLLGLGADIFERYRGMKQEKEGVAGLEGLEAGDKARMKIYIDRMRSQAQAPSRGQMGPPSPVPGSGGGGQMGPPAPMPQAPMPQAPMPQAPRPNIPPPNLNIPQDQFAIEAGGDTTRGQGRVSVGGPPPPGGLPPPGISSLGGRPTGGASEVLTPEQMEIMQKWLQGLRR